MSSAISLSGRILVTGADGFIGKNLLVRLKERTNVSVSTFVRGDDIAGLPHLLSQADAVVHLAGENRPAEISEFSLVNEALTASLCNLIRQIYRATGRQVPLLLASSTQAADDNPYGKSKRAAEEAVQELGKEVGNPGIIFRLPGVFGKWCKPNYNSVVATFCHNIARGLPIHVNDPAARVRLVFVDDVISAFIAALESPERRSVYAEVEPQYTVTVEELANQIRAFKDCRHTLMTERVGAGFLRALYATYVSYLPKEEFSYEVPQYEDPRGVFVEMLKTPDSGQFSFFTAHPGVTRGGHYHHTKTEKFLVIKGEALFRFRHLLNGEIVEVRTTGGAPRVVDTIPGWVHDITNVGNDDMVVMLWANENFDRLKPDTIPAKV